MSQLLQSLDDRTRLAGTNRMEILLFSPGVDETSGRKEAFGIMIVTEYNKNIQGFLVHSVDNIVRLAWEDVKAPPAVFDSRHGSLVTAVSELEGKGLIMIMDVEKVLAEAANIYQDEEIYRGLPRLSRQDVCALLANVILDLLHKSKNSI